MSIYGFSKSEFLDLLEDAKPRPRFQFKTKIVWFNAIGFLFMHCVGIYGFYLGLMQLINFKFATSLWTAILVFLGGEGITMGAHRLWTHRSYKANLPLQIILMALQTLAGQNCTYIWARDHRQHHMYSDTDADPHNSNRGFFFSHIGWLMMRKHEDVLKSGKNVDMSDLEADKVVMFQKKYYKPLYVLMAMVVPIGVPMYFWNEDFFHAVVLCYFTRYIALLNITWCVNSVAHMFGYRPYDKNLTPVESFFVSFIALGEGWHNYHHAFPWDYKAAEMGTGYNGTRHFIELLSKIGWAYDLRIAPQSMVESRAMRKGDGTYVTQNVTKQSNNVSPLRRRTESHG